MVLGEARFHTCVEAEAWGIGLLLPGHFASERFAVEDLAELLAKEFPEVQVWASREERDRFNGGNRARRFRLPHTTWARRISIMVRALTALPVYNEINHVSPVLDEVLRHCRDVLVVDDGSRDGTASVLAARGDVRVVTHPQNRGYGAALQSAFTFALQQITTCW